MTNETFSVKEFEKKYVARLEDRTLDWNVLKFQEEIDPRYKRAQMRYIGRGATANNDSNVVAAEHFTLSTMVLPPGCIGPLHLHDDVEEVFFILEGEVTALIQEVGKDVVHEIKLNARDCISSPPGVHRGIRNDGDTEARMLVMLGAVKPNLPTYPEGSALEDLRKQRAKEREAIIKG
ncbi:MULTISPECIES: cupin domain-containing protein [unclassified Bacillus (in: firmicutes)]|uniref:cupin domain-containing protein n=1 Tax=unclassified Bacillus (in: firmicutes) TaxID=185979 RepID=UPI000BF1E405|nr:MULTISPECIES: cupin domain-containing protein [unclassified Bacillus (in: firmicutes)]PEJ59617.1 cupin [Bacillus sp. AFS002410]PEL05836.1 cupin [Bacillus sp. AFS017336]